MDKATGTAADDAPSARRQRGVRTATARSSPEPQIVRAATRRASTDGEEEVVRRKLWRDYRRRSSDAARNRLVEAYQSLAHEIVRRFTARLPRSVDRGDLDTAASVGLIAAIGGFDRERGVPFESYCELRVKGAMLDELRKQDWLPRPWRARLEQQKRVCERLRSEQNRDPSDDAVAAAMEMPLVEYQQIFGVGMPGSPGGSAQEPAGEDAAPGLEVLADPNGESAGERLTRDELLRVVAQKLSLQEARIVYLKYWEELSMREIGELLDLSESRVCKIHTKLIDRLKDRFRVGLDE